MRIYIAGRMRGIPEFNFPAFDHAATVLRDLGHECFNPADNDRALGFDGAGWRGDESLAERNFDLRAALADDLDYIARSADAICALPGWEDSRGARAEIAVAHALDIPVAPLDAFDHTGPAPHLRLQVTAR
jgi:hypothetical protein